MQSRAARVTCSAVAWLAIGGAATFLIYSEREIAERRATTGSFDLRAREAVDALADLRAAQQAYVAAAWPGCGRRPQPRLASSHLMKQPTA